MDTGDNLTRREFVGKMAKTTAAVTLVGAVPYWGCSTEKKSEDTIFDVIVKGGTIYDGTLSKPFVADIGIEGDKISAIGTLTQKAAKTIDAAGLIVTPGFIDIHTHCDLTFKRMGTKRYLSYVMPSWKGNHNYLYQGVTTVVTGNCGYGYTDAERWFSIVDSVKFGSNVYHLAPHGMIREELFGKNQPGELNAKQLDAIKAKVAEEMEKGTVGFSTGLEYAPGLMASTKELIEIAKVVQRYGGLYTTHMRDESGRVNANGNPGVLESIREAIEIGKQADIPVEISHLKIAEPINNTRTSQLIDLIEEARLEGHDLTADQYPYAAGSTFVAILLPNKFKTSTGVKEEFRTTAGRKQIKEAIEEVFTYLGPEKILITMYAEKEEYEGKNIKEIAEMEGRAPSDAYVDMACEDPAPVAVFFAQDMGVVRDLMPNDYIITASDGWTVPKDMTKPHPRVYGTFPRKLRKFAMDENLMNLEQAIRSMTSLPAEKFNMKGRGKISQGNYADIAMINLKTLTDHATYQNPHQYCDGVVHLLVNGKVSMENGKTTGKRGGRALKRV